MSRSRASGFTLIELLIVVVIIGILASIAIPKFAATKGRAYTATMKSDLRNLATAEEAYYYTNDVYSTDLTAINFQPSQGTTVTVGEASTAGWSATASHPAASSPLCAIFIGTATPPSPATVESVVACN
ncbi:MAG TPA: prepilin-type N-terminal cleavage/methylation domain-containing protein [Gemmatimonadaceae bacterium]|jgi:prepilin-type N-terminal cleavage/methylation domain-containing protein